MGSNDKTMMTKPNQMVQVAETERYKRKKIIKHTYLPGQNHANITHRHRMQINNKHVCVCVCLFVCLFVSVCREAEV